MQHETMNPASLAAGRALENAISLAAIDPENSPKAPTLQAFRAAWIARRAEISPAVAATLAPLIFGEGAR